MSRASWLVIFALLLLVATTICASELERTAEGADASDASEASMPKAPPPLKSPPLDETQQRASPSKPIKPKKPPRSSLFSMASIGGMWQQYRSLPWMQQVTLALTILFMMILRGWLGQRRARPRAAGAGRVQVSEINVYPIKSCGGISLQQSRVVEYGLEHDRRWMLIDAKNHFLSQRKYPRLALVQPRFHGNSLHVDAPNMPTLVLPLECVVNAEGEEQGELVRVTVWDDTVTALSESSAAAEWFQQFLAMDGVRLVRMSREHVRPVDRDYTAEFGESTCGFSDGFPFLLIAQESLAYLNRQLQARGQQALPMNRFRPNFVVKGTAKPFVEDTWKSFTLGSIVMHAAKDCSRCKLTTVVQEKGEFGGAEPLATLKTFRETAMGEVMFGQNLVHEQQGSVRVGDTIIVTEVWPAGSVKGSAPSVASQ